MKFIVSFAGAIVSGVMCLIAFSLVSKHQVAQIGYTPNHSDSLIDLFLLVTPFVALMGGWLSLKIYNKHLTKAQTDTEKRAA